MSRLFGSAVLFVVLAVATITGPAVASASDAKLRVLVHDQRAQEKTLERENAVAAAGIGKPRTYAAYRRRLGRFFRTSARIVGRQRRSVDTYRRRFVGEPAQTSQAARGRSLMLLGLRDKARGCDDLRAGFRRAERRLRTVRTPADARRFLRRLDADLASAVGARGERRLKQGRTLIRNAPAPPAPAAPAPPATPPAPPMPVRPPVPVPPPITGTPVH